MFEPSYNSETRVWSGPKVPPIFNSDQNLGQLIVRVLELTPDAVTQVSADTGVEVTCSEMRERILKIAVHLSDLGLKQGDVVGIMAGNTENAAPVVFACFLLGLPVNPQMPMKIEADIVQMYAITRPKVIFCDESNLKTVQNAVTLMKSDAKIYTVMSRVEGYECITDVIKTTAIRDLTYPTVDPNSTLIVLCSSGSTGAPKGICKSHRETITSLHPLYDHRPGGKPVFFVISPVSWYSGFVFLLTTSLFGYTRVITAQPYHPKRFIDILSENRVSFLMTPPFTIVNLLQHGALKALEHVRMWLFAGSTVPKDLFDKLRPFVPNALIANGYACTEENVMAINYAMRKLESCGFPAPNLEIQIADDNGVALPNNQLGEIYTKFPVHFLGYFGEPEKTEQAFHGEWYKTGDVGLFDDEGFLYVVDRKKDLMKYDGVLVTPSELENVINGIEGVTSSCVIGVPEESSGNDIIHAFVIADESRGLSESFIEAYVNERVVAAKRLRGGVHLVKSFPMGVTGKVDRKIVREMVGNLSET